MNVYNNMPSTTANYYLNKYVGNIFCSKLTKEQLEYTDWMKLIEIGDTPDRAYYHDLVIPPGEKVMFAMFYFLSACRM